MFKTTCFLLLASLVRLSYQEDCLDFIGTSSCRFYMRFDAAYCSKKNAFESCRKSCNFCSFTRPPTQAPTKGMTNPPTQPPTKRMTNPPTQAPTKRMTNKPTGVTPTSSQGSCGISSVPQSRIINGVNAVPGAWPWIVSLQKFGGHFCGGAILTPKWVITAAHCVHKIKPDRYRNHWIVVGAHDHRNKTKYTKIHAIKRIINHHYFTTKTFIGDMALIELKSPIQYNERVKPVCLPPKDQYPTIGKQCYLAGWGSITHPGHSHHTLQQTRLPVVPGKDCKHQQEVVCVGYGMKKRPDGSQYPNACRGDSGGPLVCQQADGRWQLEGVASYVYTYCKYYTGYSPVNKYLDWIKKYLI